MRTPDLEMRDARVGIDDHAEQVVLVGARRRDTRTPAFRSRSSPTAFPNGSLASSTSTRSRRPTATPAFRSGPSSLESFARRARDGLLPPIPPEHAGADEVDYELLRAGLTTTPLRCWTDPVRLTGAGERVPRTYIWCTRSGFGKVAARVREDPTWDYHTIDTKHMVMYTAPRELADLLLELAST